MKTGSIPPLKPARAVEALLGRSFPGHTMQRVRTPEGRYRYGYVGAGVKDLFNLDPEDLMARPEVDHAWIHPEDRQRFIDALETSARDLTPLDEEVRVESPSGDYRWVRSIGHPRRGEDGTIIWDGVALDVHDRRSALETLSSMIASMRDSETSEDRFSAIAAQDVNDRLEDLRTGLSDFAGSVREDQRDAFDRLTDGFEALVQAIMAAGELADTVEKAGQVDGPPSDVPAIGGMGLTSRQVEIVNLAANGASNREIGDRLGLSEGTVKQHMSRIFRKLGVQNRAEAVARLGSTRRPALG
jgi:DNA-binding CsgD family transcriptional regulator